jgi:hypothetical protein
MEASVTQGNPHSDKALRPARQTYIREFAHPPSSRTFGYVVRSPSLAPPTVLSLSNRLNDDVLITHCASWLGHVNDDTRNPEFREFPGTLTLWKWLGLRRFFPEGKEIQENSRGCAAVRLTHRARVSALMGSDPRIIKKAVRRPEFGPEIGQVLTLVSVQSILQANF